MIYVSHNFAENYLNAEAYDDSFMKQSIVVDEIARNIVDNKREIVKMLRRRGVNVTYNTDNLTLALYVSREIQNSPTFPKELAEFIVANGTTEDKIKGHLNVLEKQSEKYLSANGEEDQQIKTKWEACYNSAPPTYTEAEKASLCEQTTGISRERYEQASKTKVGKFLGKIGGWFKSDEAVDLVTDEVAEVIIDKFQQGGGEEELTGRVKMSEMKSGYVGKKFKKDRTVWIMIGVALAVGTIGYFVIKQIRAKKETKALGGDLGASHEPLDSAPAPEPAPSSEFDAPE